MTYPRYPALLAAAMAAAFIGAAAAQTQSDDSSRMPANKGMAQQSQTQPSADQADKMKGQDQTGQMKGQYGQDTSGAMPSDQKSKSDKSSSKKDKQATGSSDSGNQAMDKTNKQAMNTPKHGAKSKRPSEEVGTPEEKAYRDALRDCAKQADETQRGSCLDSAIERFHRSV